MKNIEPKSEKRERVQKIDLRQFLANKKNVVKEEKEEEITKVKKTIIKKEVNNNNKKSLVTYKKPKKSIIVKKETPTKKIKDNTHENSIIEIFDEIESIEIGDEIKYVFNGSAKRNTINGGNENGKYSFELTPKEKRTVGSVFTKQRVNIESGFKCNFKFQIKGKGGADGFAFVIQNSKNTAITSIGSGLGYNGMKDGLIAIEFDVFRNDLLNDPNDHHISIQTAFNNQLSNNHKHSIGAHLFSQSINDGKKREVEIIYNSIDSNIKVFLISDSSGTEIKNLVIDSKIPYKLPTSAFIGFTASCGDLSEQHLIYNFSIETLNNINNNNKKEE